jgi:hypothetical protein
MGRTIQGDNGTESALPRSIEIIERLPGGAGAATIDGTTSSGTGEGK